MQDGNKGGVPEQHQRGVHIQTVEHHGDLQRQLPGTGWSHITNIEKNNPSSKEYPE